MRRLPWLQITALLVIVILPFFLARFGLSLWSEIFIMAIFAMSLGLIIGYAGLVSLGHAAFFGLGAYTVALVGHYLPTTFVSLLLVLVLSIVVAYITGALFIRTSGAYFLMLTLAFGQVLFAIAAQFRGITGGFDGMPVTANLDFGFGPIRDRMMIYYVMALFFVLSYLLLQAFVNSPTGHIVRGIMENESRMIALGYDTTQYKRIAYTLAGTLGGFAGALYAYFGSYVSPELVNWVQSGNALIMVIVGGVGTLIGPAVGAAFFIVLQSYVSSYTERWPLIMGIIFVAFVLAARGGIVQLLALGLARLSPRRFGNLREVETYSTDEISLTSGEGPAR